MRVEIFWGIKEDGELYRPERFAFYSNNKREALVEYAYHCPESDDIDTVMDITENPDRILEEVKKTRAVEPVQIFAVYFDANEEFSTEEFEKAKAECVMKNLSEG